MERAGGAELPLPHGGGGEGAARGAVQPDRPDRRHGHPGGAIARGERGDRPGLLQGGNRLDPPVGGIEEAHGPGGEHRESGGKDRGVHHARERLGRSHPLPGQGVEPARLAVLEDEEEARVIVREADTAQRGAGAVFPERLVTVEGEGGEAVGEGDDEERTTGGAGEDRREGGQPVEAALEERGERERVSGRSVGDRGGGRGEGDKEGEEKSASAHRAPTG